MTDQNKETWQTVKCIVAGTNSDGQPDVFFLKLECTKEQFEDGAHYDMAYCVAESKWYDPCICFDEKDVGFKHFKIDWETIETTRITKHD